MKNICMVGTGYVGLVTGACFAELGNKVTCLDVDAAKIELLNTGGVPIYEPGLTELVQRNTGQGRLSFTTSYESALRDAEFVFIAVNTPPDAEGSADLSYVRSAAISIAQHLDHDLIIVDKSTVPVGTGHIVERLVEEYRATPAQFTVVSNPEFLREGNAISDCLHPDRVVIGSDDPEATEAVASLYLWLRCPILITDMATAEMIKYASNSMLATRISFMNEMAEICEHVGADVKQVALGMGYDKRIGSAFLDAGLGYGGSCFPKDVRALIHMATVAGCHPQLLQAVTDINSDQRLRAVNKLDDLLGGLDGRTIGLLGLAFKPNTDDLREAPSIEIAQRLIDAGANVRAYDPVAEGGASQLVPQLIVCPDPYDAASGADALLLVTDWIEFTHLDMARIRGLMKTPILVDGRNLYDASELRALGFTYRGSGRG